MEPCNDRMEKMGLKIEGLAKLALICYWYSLLKATKLDHVKKSFLQKIDLTKFGFNEMSVFT